MKLSELYWHRITPLHFLLWPLSLLFRLFMMLRRLGYWLDILPSVRLSVPVIVVDSITTEDGGKTPLIIWLIDFLHVRGMRPGIVSHGYTGHLKSPMAITTASDPAIAGGKLLLLAQRCKNSCPIWVGDDRITAAQALLAAHPDCNVLISNDGLQHHRLERDLEIVAVDFSEHSFGNGLILPAGPIRESFKRLQDVDVVAINDRQRQRIDTSDWAKIINIKLVSETFYNLLNPDLRCAPAELIGKRLHAIADLDNSQRFFDQLQHAKLAAVLHSFAENHLFVKQDLQFPDAEAILMPEEDALKCMAFADDRLWALPVDAWISGELREIILKKLRKKFMDTKYLDALVCPLCKGSLRYKKDENELICSGDRLAFPIKDGIPVMLEEEARKLSPNTLKI